MPRELEKIEYLDINTMVQIKKLTNGHLSWFIRTYLKDTTAQLQHVYHAFDNKMVAPYLIDEIEQAYIHLVADTQLHLSDIEEITTFPAYLNRVACIASLPDAFILEQAPILARLAKFYAWSIENKLIDIPKKKKSMLI